MIKWLICRLWGHKTVHKAVNGQYDTIDRLTGLPTKGHYYDWRRTPYCTRCGKDVRAEAPPLEARIAKACDKVLSDEDALAEMEAKQ